MASEMLFKLNLDEKLPADIEEIAIRQGENAETKGALIKELRSMIFEKEDCTPHRTDDQYLTKFLRARLWNVDLSYKLLCNYYEFRENNRGYHEKVSCLDLISIAEKELVTVSPHRDQQGHRVLIIRLGAWEPSKMSIEDIFKLVMLILEIGSLEPISQVVGGVGIFDLGGLTMNHVFHMSPSAAQKVIAMIVTCNPLRTTAIHIVNQSWIFNALFNLFKPLLNARMRERLFIHGSDMNSLHKFIEPKYLPKRYGGIHPDYPYSMWMGNLKEDDKIKWELEQLGYIVKEK